jgi:hypothetical protein
MGGLVDVPAVRQINLHRALKVLRGVDGNAALLLHRDGQSVDEVQQYLEEFGLRTPQEAEQTLKFIQNALFRSYVFNCTVGEALLAPVLEGPEAISNFRRLLSEPFTPAQLRTWSAQPDAP